MQPANRQITSLQQTSSNDIYSVSDPDDPRFSLMSPHMQRLQHTMELYLVKPKTRKGQLFCWLFWLGFAASVGLLFWQVLPRFVDHVVKPTINYIERHFTKVQVAAIALAGMAVFPVFFVSSTPIMLLVSAVLGFWWGFLVATLGTTIGMLLAFLVGKQIFHDRLHRWVLGNHKAEAMLLAISEAGPFKVVILMRQIVPYTWLNYAASAPPEITLPWYMLASVLGQIPHNAVDVYLGGNVTGLGDLLAGKPANTATIVTYTLGFTAAALTAGLAYFYAKRALRKIEQRALQSEVDVPPGLLEIHGDSRQPNQAGAPDQDHSLGAKLPGQPMLSEQQSNADIHSPSVEGSTECSPHDTLLQHTRMVADIENG